MIDKTKEEAIEELAQEIFIRRVATSSYLGDCSDKELEDLANITFKAAKIFYKSKLFHRQ